MSYSQVPGGECSLKGWRAFPTLSFGCNIPVWFIANPVQLQPRTCLLWKCVGSLVELEPMAGPFLIQMVVFGCLGWEVEVLWGVTVIFRFYQQASLRTGLLASLRTERSDATNGAPGRTRSKDATNGRTNVSRRLTPRRLRDETGRDGS